MTEFIEKLAKDILESDGFSVASNKLFQSYVSNLVGEESSLSKPEIKDLLTTAQIFYKSDDGKLKKEGAILLAMILDTCGDAYPEIIPVATSVFINSGDFPNTNLLEKRHPDVNFSFSFLVEAQNEFRKNLNSVPELEFSLTDYQRALWADLVSDKDVITSAPTSAGKTHIILNYLVGEVGKGDGAFAAIVVPTRALISEVAGKIYELSEDLGYSDEIEICTIPKDGDFKDKTFFVMTQERLHEVLMRGDLSFDYFFLDEAHNITDESRGVLLHMTIEKLLDDSNPQIIISMPSSNYQNSFASIFKGIEFTKEITNHSPVAKLLISVVLKGRDLLISRDDSLNMVQIPKRFTGKRLANVVLRLGQGESNIIYRNRTDYCENLANDIAGLISEHEGNPLLEEAADYVEQFIHENFSLADNLRKGAAFHYGPLPSSVRIMIENLVKDNQIKYIACTSTLAEGVNLPAKNLFLQNPVQPVFLKPSERIEDVKINNITGRAGRMLQHFSGNIFLIEPEEWDFTDYFEEKAEDVDKIPTYFKTLNEQLPDVLSALRGTYAYEDGNQYRFYSIANKLLREFSNERLDETFSAQELDLTQSDRSELKSAVQEAYNALKVPAFTLEANPTTGYIQQNELFKILDAFENYDDWILPHPRAANLYEVLFRVSELLQLTGVFVPNEGNTLGHICSISKKWIQGTSLKDIITEQIGWESSRPSGAGSRTGDVNRSVRNVIKVIDNDVRFRLSNALRCYDVLLTSVLLRKEIERTSVKLHFFIEIGASDERMMSLINLGLSREAAKDLHEALPQSVRINSAEDIVRILNTDLMNNVHAINKREISGLLSGAS